MTPDHGGEEERDRSDGSASIREGSRRRARRVIGRSLAALAAVMLALLVAAWSGAGLGRVVPFALERAVPDGWVVDVGEVRGSWLGRIEMVGLSLEGPSTTLSAERLLLRYRVRPLLGKNIEIPELLLERPSLRVTTPDGADEEEAPDTARAGGSMVASMLAGQPVSSWSVRVGSVRIIDGIAGVRTARDASRYDLSSFRFLGRGALAEHGLALRVDTLSGDFVSVVGSPADSAFRSAGRLALAGSLAQGELTLDTLLLSSDHSDVDGGGRAAFSNSGEILGNAGLEIVADPLDLRDLPFALPAPLAEHPQVAVSLSAEGTPDSVLVTVDVERFGAHGHGAVRAVVRPEAGVANGGPPAVDGSLQFEALELAGWSAPPFDGTATGDVAFTLGALGAAASYTAEGSVAHHPAVVDPSRILAGPLRVDFQASGRLPGDSSRVDPLRTDADVTLFAGPSWTSLGRGTARVRGTGATWSVDLALDSGRVAGKGRVDWGDDLVAEIDALRLDRFDLAAVDTVYPTSRITGEASGRLRGTDPETMEGEATAHLASSTIRDLRVDTLSLSSAFRGLTFTGGLYGRTDVAEARARYRVQLVDTVLRFDADSLDLALPDSVQGAPPRAELFGRASGTWALTERRAATLRASLDSARWTTTTVSRGTLRGELDGERMVADIDLDARGLTPGALGVEAHADFRGTTLPEMVGSGRATLRRAHAGTEGRADSVRVQVRSVDPGRFRVEGSAYPAEGGDLAFSGSGAVFPDSLSFAMEADGAFRDPLGVVGGAAVDSLRVRASGRRVLTRWEDLSGEIDLAGTRWRQLEASRAMASVRYDSTGLRLDTLQLHSNVVEASGGGSLPVGGSGGQLAVQGRLLDLEPVRELTGLRILAAGDGSFHATASGSLDSLSWTTDSNVEAVVVNDIRMTGLGLEGSGVVAAPYDFLFGLSSVDVELALDRVVLPQSEVRSVRTTVAGGSDSLRVEIDAAIDGRRNASALVHVDPRPDRKRARIDDIRFQVDDDEWRLAEDAIVQYQSGISVEPVLLRAGQQEIRLEGGVSEEGLLDLNARMDSTDIGTVADLAGFPRLRGWMTGRVRVQGPTDAPEAWLDASGAFNRPGRPPGPMEITVRANGRRARGNLRLRDARSGSLDISAGLLFPGASPGAAGAGAVSDTTAGPGTAAASTVFGLSTDSIDVAVDAQAFDARWAEAFLTSDQLASLTGTIQGSMRLRGSSSDPVLEGRLGLRDGSARPTALGVQWDALALSLRGDGAQLVVDTARISGSSGRLTAEGTVGVTGSLPLDLSVSMRDFQAIRTDAYWAVVSGSLDVGGAATAPEMEGDLRLESLDIFLDERVTSQGLEPVELTEADLAMLRDRFGVVPDTGPTGRPLAERITADLEVTLGRDSWLRKRTSPEMAVPFSGTLEVALRPGQLPELQGSVEVTGGRGFVEQFGRRFVLSEGTVTFNGAPDSTSVDLTATYTIPSHDNPDDAEVTIILEVTGTQSDLGLTLSSDPPMENADIVSYIATGRPAAGSLSFESQQSNGGLVAAGAGYALSQMTSVIETAAARSVGLDVVEIRREGLRQAKLVAGKYLSPRLYVGFAQPVSLQEGEGLSFGSEGQTEVEIEYEALRWLLLNLEGSGSSIRFFLRGRRAY